MTNTISSKTLKQIVENEINDTELKKRLSRLGSPHLDTVICEAGVVLENRLRSVTGLNDLHGVKLVDEAFSPSAMKLIYSQHLGEQEGVKMLYRGAMQFIRNPPMHNLVEYPIDKARLLLRLVDSLLLLLPESPTTGNNGKRSTKISSSDEFLEKVKGQNPASYEAMRIVLSKMQEVVKMPSNRCKLEYQSMTANLYWQDKNGHWRRFFTLNSRLGTARVRMDYLRKGGYVELAAKIEKAAFPFIAGILGKETGGIKVIDSTVDDLCQLVEELVNVFTS